MLNFSFPPLIFESGAVEVNKRNPYAFHDNI